MTRPGPPGTGDDDGAGHDEYEGATGIPRWVKLTGIVLAVLALIVVVVLLVGGGGHSPRRHGSSTSTGQAPPTSATYVLVPLTAGSG